MSSDELEGGMYTLVEQRKKIPLGTWGEKGYKITADGWKMYVLWSLRN